MGDFYLQKADRTNLDAVMVLINEAKRYLNSQGIDQWQTGYPDTNIIMEDIMHGRGYLVMNDNDIAAYLCIDFDGEPSHEELTGEWKSDLPYGIIHRLAISDAYKGRGLASIVFQLAQQLCIDKGFFSIHADTDEANVIMRHVLAKNGFDYCGTIWFDNSLKYAYEKVLN